MAGSSDPRTAPRPGPSYARFLVFLEAWILSVWKLQKDCWSVVRSTRPEARGLGGFLERNRMPHHENLKNFICHFEANLAFDPEICSTWIPIRTNSATLCLIRPKVTFQFFGVSDDDAFTCRHVKALRRQRADLSRGRRIDEVDALPRRCNDVSTCRR